MQYSDLIVNAYTDELEKIADAKGRMKEIRKYLEDEGIPVKGRTDEEVLHLYGYIQQNPYNWEDLPSPIKAKRLTGYLATTGLGAGMGIGGGVIATKLLENKIKNPMYRAALAGLIGSVGTAVGMALPMYAASKKIMPSSYTQNALAQRRGVEVA